MKENMKSLCRKILKYTQDSGAEKAECCLQLSRVIVVSVNNGKIYQINSTSREEVLIRLIKEHRSISTIASSFDFNAISNAVDDCIRAIESIEPDEHEDISDGPVELAFIDGDSSIDTLSLIELVQNYLNDINTKYPQIIVSDLQLPAIDTSIVYGNTNQVELAHSFIKYDCFIEYTSETDKQKCSYYYDFSFSKLPSKLLDLYEQCFWYNLKSNVTNFQRPSDIRNCKILLAPSVVEDIIIDGIYTFCNSVAIMSDASIWNKACNTAVADKRLSIALDPYNESIICGERITDNGTLSQPFYLIHNGILENFCLSRKASSISGFPMAANTSDSIVVSGGEHTFDEIISKISCGIIISRFSGGDISLSGDFSGLAKNCYLIENGEIVSSVNDIRIYGNVVDMLNGIEDLSIDHNINGYSIVPWALMDSGIFFGECDDLSE